MMTGKFIYVGVREKERKVWCLSFNRSKSRIRELEDKPVTTATNRPK